MAERVNWIDMQSINKELIIKTIMNLIEENRDSEDLTHFNKIGELNMKASQVWTTYMASFGGKILKYAKGFAAMRNALIIDEEDIKKAIKFHESTIDKYVMNNHY